MNGYYYLLTSLPELDINSSQAIEDADSFISKLEFFIPKKDFKQIKSLINNDKDLKIKVLEDYLKKKQSIDALLLEKREIKLRGESREYKLKQPVDSQINSLVDKVFNNSNPLEAEKEILSLYWKILDEIGAFHNFDFTTLCVYVLKMQLLRRLKSFDANEGKKEFNNLFEKSKISYGAFPAE